MIAQIFTNKEGEQYAWIADPVVSMVLTIEDARELWGKLGQALEVVTPDDGIGAGSKDKVEDTLARG